MDINILRERYTKGCKLKLTAPLEDKYSPKAIGDVMIVEYVDDMGNIHGSWQSGGSLALIQGVDSFVKIE